MTFHEESDNNSGVGRASPTHPSENNSDESDEDIQGPAKDPKVQDDQFTVLWYGTDDTNDSSDSDNENGIFPDVPEWNLREINEDLDDISEEDGIFPDIPTEDPAETNENPDDISEEEEEENNIISQIRIANFESLSDDALPGLRITSISSLQVREDIKLHCRHFLLVELELEFFHCISR